MGYSYYPPPVVTSSFLRVNLTLICMRFNKKIINDKIKKKYRQLVSLIRQLGKQNQETFFALSYPCSFLSTVSSISLPCMLPVLSTHRSMSFMHFYQRYCTIYISVCFNCETETPGVEILLSNLSLIFLQTARTYICHIGIINQP